MRQAKAVDRVMVYQYLLVMAVVAGLFVATFGRPGRSSYGDVSGGAVFSAPFNFVLFLFVLFLLTKVAANMSAGIIRRERHHTASYIHGFQRRMAVVLVMQVLLFFIAMYAGYRTPWIPSFHLSGFQAPKHEQCRLDINTSYIGHNCIRNSDPRLFDEMLLSGYQADVSSWTNYANGQSLRCRDGGFGAYASLYDACAALIFNTQISRVCLHGVYVSFYILNSLLMYEQVMNLDETVTLDNFLKSENSWCMKLAISMGLLQTCLITPLLFLDAMLFILGRHGWTLAISSWCSAIFSLLLLGIEWAISKYKPKVCCTICRLLGEAANVLTYCARPTLTRYSKCLCRINNKTKPEKQLLWRNLNLTWIRR